MCSPISSFHIPPRLDQPENWCPCVHFTTTWSDCVERKPLLAWLSFRGNGERLHWDKVDPRCSQDCESIAVNILSWSRVRNGDTCDRVKSCHRLFHHGPEVCLFSSFFPFPCHSLWPAVAFRSLYYVIFINVIIDAFVWAVELSFFQQDNGSDWLRICYPKEIFILDITIKLSASCISIFLWTGGFFQLSSHIWQFMPCA